MIQFEPQILEKDGKKEFVVLSYDDFLRVEEELECYEDLRLLREAKSREGAASTLTLTELKRELEI